nr:hypothetical protein [Tanacetum cinerariifolium]
MEGTILVFSVKAKVDWSWVRFRSWATDGEVVWVWFGGGDSVFEGVEMVRDYEGVGWASKVLGPGEELL